MGERTVKLVVAKKTKIVATAVMLWYLRHILIL